MPRISIVTPSYNTGKYLRATLDSLREQTFSDFEHIVVDGGSTDDTLSILEPYKGTYPLRWISEKDKGQADAINKGLRMTTGGIIAYLNADDLYYPRTLEHVAAHFERKPASRFLFGRCRVINEDGSFSHDFEKSDHLKSMPKSEWQAPTFKMLLTKNTGVIPQPAAFWKREVMDKIGLFDPSFHYTMDYEYWLRVSEAFPIDFIDELLAAFRMHDASKSGSLMMHRFWGEAIRASRMHGGSAWSGISWAFLRLYLTAPFRLSAYKSLYAMIAK